ncbi:MAG: NUDIX hydrolase [Burkholderiaceae bacterium]|jgi:ADP-ribose pyrophosphatase YjhB (NUDIX family)|nr:NUDIX hydrolase [Burkholderiaceae bacterium]
MKFCSQCAHPVVFEIPPDDNLPRYICLNCKTIHYQNPKIVVCSIPFWNKEKEVSILLCRRAIEPRQGFWTLPGGFMENNETTREAALRETEEEAGADVVVRDLFALMNLPTVQQVHLFYLAELRRLSFAPGLETLETRMFTEREIPWSEIAFTSTRHAIEMFFSDPQKALDGQARLYSLDLKRLVFPV